MLTNIDYKKRENRWLGFDNYYKFTTATEDSTADLVCERRVAQLHLRFTPEDMVALSFWFGAVGSPASIIFAKNFGNFSGNSFNAIMHFFEENKHRISFASDAKYRKIHFEQFIKSLCNSLGNKTIYGFVVDRLTQYTGTLDQQPYLTYNALHDNCIDNWWQWGRMGQWCFAEALNSYTDIPILPRNMEFGEQGKSHTAGWLLANEKRWLDSNHTDLSQEAITDFENWAKDYLTSLKAQGYTKNVNFYTLETACCNYKRQHKGSRYAGCYIDELYDDLQKFNKDWPEYIDVYYAFMEARQAVLPNDLLYENSDDFVPNKPAYQESWHEAFMEYGRMPRVEAWINKDKQRWCDLVELGYDHNLEGMWT